MLLYKSIFLILATLLCGLSEVDGIGDLNLLFVLIPKYVLAIYNNINLL